MNPLTLWFFHRQAKQAARANTRAQSYLRALREQRLEAQLDMLALQGKIHGATLQIEFLEQLAGVDSGDSTGDNSIIHPGNIYGTPTQP